MSKTSDVVEPVLDDIIENIQLEVEDIEDTTTANIQLEAKDIEDTTTTTTDIIMSKPSTSKKDKEEALIKKLLDEKKEIEDQIEEIEENKDVNTEKTIHLRNLRAKKRDIIKELRIILEKIEEEKYEELHKKKIKEKESKTEEELQKIFGTTHDTLKPSEDNKTSFIRNFNMFGKYRDSIKSLKDEIKHLMSRDSTEMTQQSLDERDLMIQAKISTMKTIAKEYEKHYHDLTMIGEEEQIKYLIENFTNVMEVIHNLEATVKQEEETKKKKLALAKSETLESVKLEKFSGQGENRYLKYYIWYTEFSELVMKKEYSDSVKLKFLKQYTEKEAHDLVKNYHHPQELLVAFEMLDEHYGKPSMVIRESLRNLRTMETVRSINDVKSNRNLLSKINTNISTLRCYNFDLEGEDIENSSFLIEMEEKIPHIAYTKWEEEKVKLKADGEEISIEGFIKFYTNLINIEEKAQYIRKQSKPAEGNKPGFRTMNSYYASMRSPSNDQKKNNPGATPPKKDYNRGGAKGNFQRQGNAAQTPGNGGLSTPRYCIFCETNTHDTGFCKISKYTADYKTQQCQKHNACYMCFKTSEHKANTCPKIMKCFLCPRMHHFNNHSRQEINDYYKRKKKQPKQ